MKFALYDFFQEDTMEVGLAEFIEGYQSRTYNNEAWAFGDEVTVNWPKNGRKGQDVVRCLARIKKFSGKAIQQQDVYFLTV
jgi:hypothetical protein